MADRAQIAIVIIMAVTGQRLVKRWKDYGKMEAILKNMCVSAMV